MLKLKSKDSYLTMKTPDSSIQYLTFKDARMAQKCKRYCIEHKIKFGGWPMLDLSKNKQKVALVGSRTDFDEDYVDIENVSQCDLEIMMKQTNTSAFYCLFFDSKFNNGNTIDLHMTGQEMEITYDQLFYLSHLEYILNKK
jgi:hypothetical protein